VRTTTYKCDKCGQEDTTNALELADVGVFVGTHQHYGGSAQKFCREWCLKCRRKAGLAPDKEHPRVQPEPVLSLEDMVREIMRERSLPMQDDLTKQERKLLTEYLGECWHDSLPWVMP